MAQSNMLEPDLKQRSDWKVGSKVVERFDNDIKPYAHDIATFIEVNKKDLFEEKQSNEDVCVKRVNLGVINAMNMDGGKELLSVRYCIDDDDEQLKVVERFGNDIKPYARDIMAFIEVNKKDLFEGKLSNEDACAKRVKFVSKIYSKWMMMS
eukprot:965400_1